jgi:hypothetical protein
VLVDTGLFDEHLGPGARFSCCEDQDLCHRVLLAGHHVLIAPEARVIHHGFRTNAQMRDIWKRDALGIGGMLAKELRCGDAQSLLALSGFWRHWLFVVLGRLIRFQRPLKLRQAGAYMLYTASSFAKGLQRPVDRNRRAYLPQSWLSYEGAITHPGTVVTDSIVA